MESIKTQFIFGNELSNFYKMGFLVTDISQILVFADLVGKGKTEKAEEYFGKKSKAFNRYSSLYKMTERTPIIDVKKGSVELIAELTLAASVIMPYIIYRLQRRGVAEGRVIDLQVSPDDPFLARATLNKSHQICYSSCCMEGSQK